MRELSIADVAKVSGSGAAADGAQAGGVLGTAAGLSAEMAAGSSATVALQSASATGIIGAALGLSLGAGWEIGSLAYDYYATQILDGVEFVFGDGGYDAYDEDMRLNEGWE